MHGVWPTDSLNVKPRSISACVLGLGHAHLEFQQALVDGAELPYTQRLVVNDYLNGVLR
jgi:hypothetical protein